MKKQKSEKEVWETLSLTWIHEIRRDRQGERAGRPPQPTSGVESEKLARRCGLKLARLTAVER